MLIEKALVRIDKLTYSEGHHIVPSSLGGPDTADNIVSLSAREHFIVHLLLTKMTTGLKRCKMSYAFSFMLIRNSKLQERYFPNSKWYEYSRKLLSETQKGREFSAETRKKMSDAQYKRFKNKSARDIVSSWTKNPSLETREKIGHAARNRTPEAIQKMKAAKSRKCTIDNGATVYPSKKEMAINLGWGKSGAGSPHFLYLDNGSSV
jgi:hypothetical protein